MIRARWIGALALGALCSALTCGAVELYIKQLVLRPEGRELAVDDLVHRRGGAGSPAAGDPAILDRALDVSPRHLAVVFPAAIRARLDPHSSGALVLIGSLCMVVPLARYSAKDVWFYRPLLSYLGRAETNRQSPWKVGWIEVEVLPGSDVPFIDTGETVHFALADREGAETGIPVTAGAVELSYRLGASAARPLKLWIHRFTPDGSRKAFYTMADPGQPALSVDVDSAERVVKAGDQIKIHFRKGNIELTIPGRAFGSGAMGVAIAVTPQATQERFTGIIRGPGEVEVEIP